MLGVEMGRIGGKNNLIKRGRIRQPAFLVQQAGTGKGGGDIGRFRRGH
jgi:hypothetical protein